MGYILRIISRFCWLLTRNFQESPLVSLESVVSIADIIEVQKAAASVHIDQKIVDYIVQIVAASRNMPGDIKLGASPRASLALMRTSRALAFLDKRDYVIPDDIKMISKDVLRHRIIPSYEAEADGKTTDELTDQILREIVVP